VAEIVPAYQQLAITGNVDVPATQMGLLKLLAGPTWQ
jgi:hypothetical protein